MRWFMRGSMRLSFGLGICLLCVALLAAGCGRRRGGRPDVFPDGGTSDGNVDRVDSGPPPDGEVPPPPDGGPPPADCGDGTVDADEECDDFGPSASCDADCTFVRCGDFTINSAAGEQCDDGNTFNDDGCNVECQIEIPASCGDRVVNAGEECDAGPSGSASCDSDCTFSVCGDFTVNTAAGEQCDPGGMESFDCDVDCTLSLCGDGTINAFTEVCDDGDMSSGDGCASGTCSIEAGWTCSGEPSFCTRMGGGMVDRTSTTVLSIPDNTTTGVTSSLSVTGGTATTCTIASITVDVNITHTYIGDLDVTLTSPSGTAVLLHGSTGGTADNLVGTYPTTLTPVDLLSAFVGEPVSGSWRMQVVDGAATDVGTLNSWGIHIVCL